MARPSTSPSPVGAFFRVLLAGGAIAGAVGFPSFGVASALSQGELGIASLFKATVSAAVGAAIGFLCMRTVVREIWTAWVGLLSGVIPTSLAAPPRRLVGLALAHLAAGGLLLAHGLYLVGIGADAASAAWALFGMTSALVGLGLGLGGSLPRLWWAWRDGGGEQPDDTVSRRLDLFAWLALGALSLSSGLAETLPAGLDPAGGVPLRSGVWERGCVSTLAAVQDICPHERRYLLRARRPGRMRVAWSTNKRPCEFVIDDGERRRVFDDAAGFTRLDVDPGRPVAVTVVSNTIEGCHFQLRARPDLEDSP